MKKVIIVLLALIMLFSLAACGKEETSDKKTPITMSSFEAILKNKGFEVKELQIVPHNDLITKAKGISDKDKNLKLTIYVCSVETEAEKQYTNVYQNAKLMPSSALVMKTAKGENWSFFESTDKGTFKTAMRIDNILVFSSCDEKYKDELIELVKELEYWEDVKDEKK